MEGCGFLMATQYNGEKQMSRENELRRQAAAIETSANMSDDKQSYRREMAEARRIRAEADRIAPPKVAPAKKETLKPGVHSNFEDAAAAARAAIAKKRSG